ncbi:MAG: 3'-phosphoesterase [Thermodesulfovibrionales bacterium]|nr:3'-phosphoesterase [Thermodesulfovibrionales bacterium]
MPIFVVQLHQASHLHYDFRLEMEGVLKSWAVPKGPSMNPSEKRLAVMVEDHDIEYATFEGVIPEGHYGAGSVSIWDKGTYSLISGSLQEGKIEIFLDGHKLKGLFVILKLRGKDKEWLLIKKKDEFAETSFIKNTRRKK